MTEHDSNESVVFALDGPSLVRPRSLARLWSELLRESRRRRVLVVLGVPSRLVSHWRSIGLEREARVVSALGELRETFEASLVALSVRTSLEDVVARERYALRDTATAAADPEGPTRALPFVAALTTRTLRALGAAAERADETAPSGPSLDAPGSNRARSIVVHVVEGAPGITAAYERAFDLARGLDVTEVVLCSSRAPVATADPRLVREAIPLRRLALGDLRALKPLIPPLPPDERIRALVASGARLRVTSVAASVSEGAVITSERGAHGLPLCIVSHDGLALIETAARDERDEPESEEGDRLGASFVGDVGLVRARDLEAPRAAFPPRKVLFAPVARLTLVGPGLASLVGGAAQFFRALAQADVPVLAVWQPDPTSSLGCVVPSALLAKAVQAVHAAMGFEGELAG